MGAVRMTETSRKRLRKYAQRLDAMRAVRRRLAAAGGLDPHRLSQDERIALADKLTTEKKSKALSDFYFFGKYILNYRDMTEMHQELCAFVTQRRKDGGLHRRQLVLEPRGSFKSSVVTIGLPLWLLAQNPNLRILIDSEEYMKSRAFLAEIKAHISFNDEFRRLFGQWEMRKFKGDTWTQTMVNIAPRTVSHKEPSISTAGVDVTKVGMHYDVIICDDLVSDKNSVTREQREKIINHYKLMLSILEPGGVLIIIGTRWDFGDLYGYILDRDKERVAAGKKPRWRKLIRSAVKPNGLLLFPERLTTSFLEAQLLEQGPYIYSCQYLNDPSGAADALFNVEEWVHWAPNLPPVSMKCGIVLDPSVGRRDDSDYSAVVTVFVDPLNNWYVWAVERGRWNPKDIWDSVVRARRRVMDEIGVKPSVGMEAVSFQKVLSFYAHDLMTRREIERFSVTELNPDSRISKEMRIRGIVPHAAKGKIFFVGDSLATAPPGLRTLWEEMEQFPKGVTVDCLDALAYIPDLITAPHVPEKDKPREGFWERLIKDRNYRGKYGAHTAVVGSRIQRKPPYA